MAKCHILLPKICVYTFEDCQDVTSGSHQFLEAPDDRFCRSLCSYLREHLDTASLSRHTRDYLAAAEKAGRVVTVTGELPKSFIVTTGESPAVYISQISAGTLKKRSGYVDGISNIEK